MPGIWKFEDGQLSVYFEDSKKFRTPLNAVRCLALDSEGKLLAAGATQDTISAECGAAPQPVDQ